MVDHDRALVPAVARHVGAPAVARDWRGIDAVLPLLERMRSEGASVLVKLDGGRGPGDAGPYTVLASGGPLAGEFLRTDAHTLEQGLAYVIVGYARLCWQYSSAS